MNRGGELSVLARKRSGDRGDLSFPVVTGIGWHAVSSGFGGIFAYVVDLVGLNCCDSPVGDEGLTAGGGGFMVCWGGKSRGSQNRDSRYGCFSIAAALGRSVIRSGGGGRKMLI